MTRDQAFGTARQWFEQGRRIDMRALSNHLGIGRSTIYRWFASREALLGDIVWSVMADTIRRIESRDRGGGGPRDRFARVYGRLTETVRGHQPLMDFVADDPDYALRVLTSSYGTVQGHLIDWVSSRLATIPDVNDAIDVNDLAYAIVRMGESFVWSDMITGSPPRPDKAIAMIKLLVAGACTEQGAKIASPKRKGAIK